MIETLQNQRPNPCHGCPDRYTACSDHCKRPEFLKWKEEKALIRKNRAAYYSPIWKHEESTVKTNFRKKKRKS